MMRSAPTRLKRLEQAEARWEAGVMGVQRSPSPCRKSCSGVVHVRKRDAWVHCEEKELAICCTAARQSLGLLGTTHQQRKSTFQ